VRRLEAEIVLEYENARTADAIAKAVSPDNFKTPKGLSITTTRRGNKVLTQIRSEGKFATFIATIDDLLFCISVAEKVLQTTTRLSV